MKYKPLVRETSDGPVCHAADFQSIDENRLRMVGSTTGQPLRDGSVFAPGAFKKATKAFVENGLLLVGHDWDDLGIGMITSATEKNGQLLIEAEFHDTPTAQEARAVCIARLNSGKKVSVSIGFMPDWSSMTWYETGKDLLTYLEANGGTDGYDTAAIKKLGYCRLINTVTEIFEVSLVTVGMNQSAAATEANTLTFNDQFDEALGCLDSLVSRWEQIADKRETLGESHREKLASLISRLEPIAQKADAAPGADPAANDDPQRLERINQLMNRAMSLTN